MKKIKKAISKKKYIEPAIFKAYDIRGIYPQEINEKTAYLIGIAFSKFLTRSKRKTGKKTFNIAVGRDNRLSSSCLFKGLTRGIISQGVNVIDIGLATTPMLYFAVAQYGFDGGVIVSASHNPCQYNGFKMVREKAMPISGETGIKEIQAMAVKIKKQAIVKSGTVKKAEKSVLKDYLKFNFEKFNFSAFQPFKVVVDTANAVPGILIPEISKKSCFKFYHLFKKLDGSFPNHNPDTLVEENLRFLKKEILRQKADLGIAFDGDGDRIVFVSEKGEVVSGDLISALIAKELLRKSPRKKILYDIRFSNVVKETILENKGKPVLGRVGHSFIKEKMRKEKILFAGELSGHFYHQEHYFSEAPLFVLFKILEIISKKKKPFSEIIKPLKKYYHSGEMNFKIEDKEKKIRQLKNYYKNGRILTIDGLRVDFKDWWFLVRPSNTEPLLRLIIEATTEGLMKKKKKELIALIR
jgi:phosphomannomutase